MNYTGYNETTLNRKINMPPTAMINRTLTILEYLKVERWSISRHADDYHESILKYLDDEIEYETKRLAILTNTD